MRSWQYALACAFLICLLLILNCGPRNETDDDPQHADDDDDFAAATATAGPLADDDDGCQEIIDPLPPTDFIYLDIDRFYSTGDYVTIINNWLTVIAQNVQPDGLKDSFEINMPEAIAPGAHDLRWEHSPIENGVYVFYIQDIDDDYNYVKAFIAYRGCLNISRTGPVGSRFTAALSDLYMTECDFVVDTNEITIYPPGEALQMFIDYAEVECTVVEYSPIPGPDDVCLHI